MALKTKPDIKDFAVYRNLLEIGVIVYNYMRHPVLEVLLMPAKTEITVYSILLRL